MSITTPKRLILITILLMSAAALVTYTFTRAQAGGPQSSDHDNWEYLVVAGGNVNLSPSGSGTMRKEPGAFSREWFPVEQNLDKLGAKGWELVQVGGSSADPIFYFKRRK